MSARWALSQRRGESRQRSIAAFDLCSSCCKLVQPFAQLSGFLLDLPNSVFSCHARK